MNIRIEIILKNNRSNLNNILGKTSTAAICNYGTAEG